MLLQEDPFSHNLPHSHHPSFCIVIPDIFDTCAMFKLFYIQYAIIGTFMYFLVLHTHQIQYLLRLIMTGGQCIIFRKNFLQQLEQLIETFINNQFLVLILTNFNIADKRVKLEQPG